MYYKDIGLGVAKWSDVWFRRLKAEGGLVPQRFLVCGVLFESGSKVERQGFLLGGTSE